MTVGPTDFPVEAALQLENAKLKFEAESRALFEKHEQALRSIKIYKRTIQAIFALVLGGSIYSVFALDDYIDRRVARRIVKADRVAFALNQAQVGRWRDALATMDEIRGEVASDKLEADADFREFMYSNMLWILSQSDEINPDGRWAGQDHYDQLVKDTDFQREISTKGIWKEDEELAINMAFCILRYESSSESLSKARRYLEYALGRVYPNQRRADIHWQLALMDILEGKPLRARAHLEAAEAINPAAYPLESIVAYRNTFFNSIDFALWSQVAERMGRPKFDTTYEYFLTSYMVENSGEDEVSR